MVEGFFNFAFVLEFYSPIHDYREASGLSNCQDNVNEPIAHAHYAWVKGSRAQILASNKALPSHTRNISACEVPVAEPGRF